MKRCKACGKPIVGLFCQTPDCNGKASKRPASGFKTFEEWRRAVDKAVDDLCHLSIDDLPDVYNLHDAWTSNKAPEKVAKTLIRLSGGDFV